MRATQEQLPDALSEASRMGALHREILGLFLARLDLIEEQMQTLDRNVARRCRHILRRCSGWRRRRVLESPRRSR